MIGKGRMGFLGAVGIGIGILVGAAGPATAQVQPPPRPVVVVVEAQPISDATITANIQAKLLENVLLRQAQITIATQNGKVTLSGMVPSDTARTEALEAARTTPGVRIINDMLRLPVNSPQAPMQH